MEIKICGITNLNDAISACASDADAVGFIFYRKSPRYINPEDAANIIKKLPSHISKVGVFVNHAPEDVMKIFTDCGLTMIQLHGDEPPEYCLHFAQELLIKALSFKTENDLQMIQDYAVKAVLADSREKELYGGTGKKANWEIAARVKTMRPLILAGGLNIENIAEAIETVEPDAIDLNSGVENYPGRKNDDKIKKIIEFVRQIDKCRQKKTPFIKQIFTSA